MLDLAACEVVIFGKQEAKEGKAQQLRLDVDDYLQGLCMVPKELARLAVNCVRCENYDLPQDIATFVANLYAGFRLLNLKNDALR